MGTKMTPGSSNSSGSKWSSSLGRSARRLSGMVSWLHACWKQCKRGDGAVTWHRVGFICAILALCVRVSPGRVSRVGETAFPAQRRVEDFANSTVYVAVLATDLQVNDAVPV